MIIDVVVVQCHNWEATKELSLVLLFCLRAIETAALFGSSGGTPRMCIYRVGYVCIHIRGALKTSDFYPEQ